MQPTDKVAGLKDSDGTEVTVQEALMRGDTAYKRVIEGGATDQRIDAIQAALDGLKVSAADAPVEVRLAAVEAVLTKLKGALS
jgi:hypothetical protein